MVVAYLLVVVLFVPELLASVVVGGVGGTLSVAVRRDIAAYARSELRRHQNRLPTVSSFILLARRIAERIH